MAALLHLSRRERSERIEDAIRVRGYGLTGCRGPSPDCCAELSPLGRGGTPAVNTWSDRRRTAATFDACQISGTGRASAFADPIMGRAPYQGDGEWDKTSEVPEVHGALRWWALSKAVKPHFSKRSWRERAQSRAPATSTPEPPSATPVSRPVITR